MGDLTYSRAQDRVRTALQQRLTTADTPAAQTAVYEEFIERLLRIGVDEAELTRIARELADDPATIDWPDDR